MPAQDPDDSLVVIFKHLAFENPSKTLNEGRPVFDDMEVAEIRAPGSRDVKVFPALAISHWVKNPYTGNQTSITYAERFSHQYQQFKAHVAQTKTGTPLDHVPFLSEAKRAELRAQNIYTAEALASIEGAELKNLGVGGRELKNLAEEYIVESKAGVPNMKLQAELEALKARNAVLEEDALAAKQHFVARPEDEFEEMSLDQLREYITTNTGMAPHGKSNKRTLIRLAVECKPDKAA